LEWLGCSDSYLPHLITTSFQKPIQLKVLRILNTWVTNHFYDFEMDGALLEGMTAFLSGGRAGVKLTTAHKKWCSKILDAIKRKQRHQQAEIAPTEAGDTANGTKPTAISSPPPSSTSLTCPAPEVVWHYAKEGDVASYDLLTLHPLEIGRQITLLQFALYKAIRPIELVDTAWMKKDKMVKSPQLLKMIDHSNMVGDWDGMRKFQN